MMSLGKGAFFARSTRQKLNTRSSTEAELVAVDDVMSQVLWTRYFLQAQGYNVTDSIIHQDNQSAILLENNGRASSSQRTRHINIRYFFVADRIASNEVKVKYCPTGEMLGDFFTKPLQGTLFRKFEKAILNLKDDPPGPNLAAHRSVLGIANTIMAEPGHTVTGVTEDPEWITVTKKSRSRGRSKPLIL